MAWSERITPEQHALREALAACVTGRDTAGVERLTAAHPGIVELRRNPGGRTPLYEAVLSGHVDAVRVLLDAGARMHQRQGETPVERAISPDTPWRAALDARAPKLVALFVACARATVEDLARCHDDLFEVTSRGGPDAAALRPVYEDVCGRLRRTPQPPAGVGPVQPPREPQQASPPRTTTPKPGPGR